MIGGAVVESGCRYRVREAGWGHRLHAGDGRDARGPQVTGHGDPQRGGASLGKSFIPDISVGQRWSKYWTDEDLADIHGERIKYKHYYPLYFPQSASNPQPSYCYPDEALGEFRQWVREEYIAKHMPSYLNKKVRDGEIEAPAARAALDAFAPQKAPRLTRQRR